MTDVLFFSIWGWGAVVFLVANCWYWSKPHNEDEVVVAFWFALAILWPFPSVFAVLIGPWWALYRLFKFLRTKVSFEIKKAN